MTSARSQTEKAATEAGTGAAAGARLARLLDASPAVVHSFEAKGDFSPTYVSDNITRLFGYGAQEYLDDPDFWRGHVHPDDLARV
jgi:adenylate cyclase